MYFLDGVRGNSGVSGHTSGKPAKRAATQKKLPPVFSREAREIAKVKQEVKFTAPEIKKDDDNNALLELKGYDDKSTAIGAFDVHDPEAQAEILKARSIIHWDNKDDN